MRCHGLSNEELTFEGSQLLNNALARSHNCDFVGIGQFLAWRVNRSAVRSPRFSENMIQQKMDDDSSGRFMSSYYDQGCNNANERGRIPAWQAMRSITAPRTASRTVESRIASEALWRYSNKDRKWNSTD